MYSKAASIVAFVVLCYFSFGCSAQEQQQPLISCVDADSLPFNQTNFTGIWYEVARSPAPASSLSCVQLNVTQTNETLTVNTLYSNTTNSYYMNQAASVNINLTTTNYTYGYNASYGLGGITPVQTTFKLLKTDNSTYALVCGYTNPNDNSTSFGLVLSRTQILNPTELNQTESFGANYTNFQNTSLTSVLQVSACTTNSAVKSVPFLASFFLMFYALLKYVC